MTRAPILGAALLALSLARPAPKQDPSIPVSLDRLEMAITLDYGEGTLDGSALMTVVNMTGENVQRIPIQVGRLMDVTSVTDESGKILSYSQDVVRYSDWPTRQMNQAWIELSSAILPGQKTSIRVKWNGTVTPYTETGMLYVRDRIDSAFTILRSETGAFPTLAVPSHAAIRRAPRRDFSFDIRVTVPSYEVVALGGSLVSRTTNGPTVTYAYRSNMPVSFVNVPIAPYRVLEQSGVRVYYLPADSAGAQATLRETTRGLTLLEKWFGPQGNALSLAIMEIPNGYGSQASLGAGIIESAASFQKRESMHELYHELSHLWNAESLDKPSPRWEEGLASFLEQLMAEKLDSTVASHAYIEKYIPALVKRFGSDPANKTLAFVDYGKSEKTGYSYGVGEVMFALLYDILGEQAFGRIIGGFYQKHRVGGATTAQFVDYVKQNAPVDLTEFFSDWMYSTRWYERLSKGETMEQLARSYRSRGRPALR
jgi:hypothetical protein